jgi:TatD DNase family protein
MEEEKKFIRQNENGASNQANAQNAERQDGQGGNNHRRKKKKKSGHGGANPQNGNNQNEQNSQAQTQQKPQKQNGGHGEKVGNNGQNEGGKQKQKSQNANNQNAQKQNNNPQNQNAQKQNNNPQNQNKKQKNQNKGQENQGGGANQKDNRKDTYAYVLDGNLYLNLTNKCSNGCDFCVRNERSSYYGHYLWLKNDPTVEKVIAQVNALGGAEKFKEAVFCGFGEPTYKVAEMVALCDYFHEKGVKTRLNTNGQGNLINKRDIVPDLKGKLDLINVSLNASCVEKYQPICRSQFGESGFEAMIEFAKSCRKAGIACRFSIVDCIGEEEVEACKRLAESVRVPLYIRSYITDSE